ncbi:MAG: PqqD family peptide modification chaperone [Acidimicrobiia bacterium]|nr:PqqD family peptide modification chaperone [Acidimicrobiia bacterium]
MRRRDLIRFIEGELSGERALESAAHMTKFYRSPGSSGYHRATDFVAQLLRDNGVERVWVERFPLDGEYRLLTQTMPLAWEPLSAELRMGSRNGKLLVSYEDSPSCLPWWTPSTPQGGLTVEVVDVGTGERLEDFRRQEVRGKAVLVRSTTVPDSFAHAVALATGHGAVGVITDTLLYPTAPFRTRESLPDPVQLLRMPSNRPGLWAIAVNYHAAERLASTAGLQAARVWVDIQAKTFKGEAQNLFAEIPGADRADEFIHFVCHSTAGTKPGANCASGPALLAEVGRVISRLISDELIPPPRRTIRFLVDVEGHGTKHYLHNHREEAERGIVSIALDSVGHHQGKSKSALLFYHSPDSVPTFINDYFVSLIEATPKETRWVFSNDDEIPFVNFPDLPYTPWSDNKYYPAFGIASPLFMSWPDLFFHTDFLKPGMLDPAVFLRCGMVSALAALEVAYAGPREGVKIMREVTARSELRLSRIALRSERPALATRKRLAHLAWRDIKAIESAMVFADQGDPEGSQALEDTKDRMQRRVRDRLDEVLGWLPEGAPEEDFAPGSVVPRRLVERDAPGLAGTSYETRIRMAEEMKARDPRMRYDSLRIIGDEIWNLTDGRRSVNDVADAIAAEFDFDLEPRHILELFEGLVREGFIGLDGP